MRATFRFLINALGWVAAVIALAGLVLVLLVGKLQREYIAKAAAFPLEKINEVPQRSAVYDANGDLYSHLPGLNRQVVKFDQVSGWFVQALLAREDAGFWQHKGIELRSIARAALANLRGGGIKQGASTITQQLARNSFDLGGRTYQRKALEAALAVRIEQNLSKQQILEAYMNRVYFGAGLYGIEAAARGYFGKSAAELNLGESAILAGLICSPNRFSPARHPELATAERDEVLARMVEEQMITQHLATAAKALKVETMGKPAFHTENDYLTDAVLRSLAEVLDPEVIERGGLRVTTTIDPQLQKAAEEAANRRLTEIEAQKKWPHPKKADFVAALDEKGVEKPTDYLQAAVVVVDNRTSAIRACVGGRDYRESKYNRALLSYRQIGSTFKPFVYSAAFERGLLPGSLVNDDRIVPHEFADIPKNWSPDNSDGDYVGLQPASFGLIKSRNTMSVRVGESVGLPNVRKLADAVGVGEKMPPYPVAYLGAFETNLKNLTAAYTVFPNGGVYREPYLIAKVENHQGELLYSASAPERRVMRPETAWLTTTCLQEVMRTGTAAKAGQLGWKKPGAGKTGTTNDFHDAWFVGYTQSLTCGVWVGMDQPQTIMEKGYGSALALPIWVDVMQAAPERTYPAPALSAPVTLVQARLCSVSGALAGSGCEAAHAAYSAQLPTSRVPQQRCTSHLEIAPLPSTLVQTGGTYPGYPTSAPNGYATAQASNSPIPGLNPPTSPTPSAPPLIINGNRVVAGGGARPLTNPTGTNRSDVSWRMQDGVRIMRAQPVDSEAPTPVRIERALPVQSESSPAAKVRVTRSDRYGTVIEERTLPPEREVARDRDDEDQDDRSRDGERRGLFHRIFAGGRR